MVWGDNIISSSSAHCLVVEENTEKGLPRPLTPVSFGKLLQSTGNIVILFLQPPPHHNSLVQNKPVFCVCVSFTKHVSRSLNVYMIQIISHRSEQAGKRGQNLQTALYATILPRTNT